MFAEPGALERAAIDQAGEDGEGDSLSPGTAYMNHEGDMLLNGVYLVENGAVEAFEELVLTLDNEYRPRGIEIELTGPWPAYNFVKTSIESAR